MWPMRSTLRLFNPKKNLPTVMIITVQMIYVLRNKKKLLCHNYYYEMIRAKRKERKDCKLNEKKSILLTLVVSYIADTY